ncbi:hypothetical protein LTR66_016173 [Elasticomyces elasticus]|nr:hypothetical protein LTR66_016173 [Elasticomyces elasticus]
MEHLYATVQASNAFGDHVEITPTNCFGGTIDIDELLALFSLEGLHLKLEHGEAALQACANLEYSKMTQEDFLGVMKDYCTWHKSAGNAAHAVTGAMPAVGAAFGLILALVKVSNSIKDRAQKAKDKAAATELRTRYLKGLATADGLSLETTKIAVVVQELIARGIDDYETINLNSSSNATIALLKEDLLPFLRKLHLYNHDNSAGTALIRLNSQGVDASSFNLYELRQKRWELKQRLIRQHEIVNVHYTRVGQGMCELRAGMPTYYMKTNRLVAYARESMLEIHLRAWYTMMGYFDPANSMIETDDRNVITAAHERISTITSTWQEYTRARLELLVLKLQGKKDVKDGSSKHEHSCLIVDQGADGDAFVARLSVKALCERADRWYQDPEGGSVDFNPDGSCEIWNNSFLSKEDRSSGAARHMHDSIRGYVVSQLDIGGPVWLQNLGFVDRMRNVIQPTLPGRRLSRISTAPPRLAIQAIPNPITPGYVSSANSSWTTLS